MPRPTQLTLLFLAASRLALPAEPPGSRDFFEKRIRPVLAKSCFGCHASTKMGGLDMASREGLLKGGNSGPALNPGKPAESLLIQAVNHQHERIKMPLQQPKLADEHIANLVDWVQAGAYWPPDAAVAAPKGSKYVITPAQKSFWAFQTVRQPQPPPVKNGNWPRTNIDRFLLARMESKSVSPAKPADKRTLLRRAYFDLIGLPPSAAEIDAFVNDTSVDAFKNVVERLLASPRYGERWARYWLDVARYSDDRLESEVDAPYANAFRYRDWVIQAFNDDMPYDRFVKAQIAGDLLDSSEKYVAGLGFYALRPDTQDDRVDVTGRAFLALTTGCAQCHNHKFDPIPTADFYSWLGIFESTRNSEFPLAPQAVVDDYKAREKAIQDKKAQITGFLKAQADQLAEMLASQTARYLQAARLAKTAREDARTVAERRRLDAETLGRWVEYLPKPKDHPYLKDWEDASKFDDARFQERVLAVWKERKAVDEENLIRKAEAKRKGPKATAEPVALKTESFYLWRDIFFNDFYGNQFKQEDDGLLYYGPNRGFYETDGAVERFLLGPWRQHLEDLRAELATLKAQLPAQYPFLHTIQDAEKPRNERIHISGSAENLGEEVPRGFLTVLCDGSPRPFEKGSGRLELAEAIASRDNPLTPRVMANRVWHHHFGSGIVRTPSDFGFMGDRPSHPELLDYLAARLVGSGWSVKALHREIMLSAAYQTSSERVAANEEIDPDNRLLWRAPIRRLDAEALRDSMLAVSGELNLAGGGPPRKLADASNDRRGVYGFVSRRKLDGTLALFDFPNPNASSEKRTVTITPPQQLFFLNGEFVMDRARTIAGRATGSGQERIRQVYRTVFGRLPNEREMRLGLEFLGQDSERWPQYAQALLNSNEFVFVK